MRFNKKIIKRWFATSQDVLNCAHFTFGLLLNYLFIKFFFKRKLAFKNAKNNLKILRFSSFFLRFFLRYFFFVLRFFLRYSTFFFWKKDPNTVLNSKNLHVNQIFILKEPKFANLGAKVEWMNLKLFEKYYTKRFNLITLGFF